MAAPPWRRAWHSSCASSGEIRRAVAETPESARLVPVRSGCVVAASGAKRSRPSRQRGSFSLMGDEVELDNIAERPARRPVTERRRLPVVGPLRAGRAGADEPIPRGDTATAKEALLTGWLRDRGSVLVGYSGGVDSAYLAVMAVRSLGATEVLAVTGRSASYPAEQWAAARRVAVEFGIPVIEVDTDELRDPRYAANGANRCYFCKGELWSRLVPIAQERGIRVVIDGTNADDLVDHRPGARAAREWGVESPMAVVGLTKAEIRIRSRALGLPTWGQPSSPCLSSRIPYGTPVTVARLRRIEVAEQAVRSLGVAGDVRVRDHGDLARVELAPDTIATWLDPVRQNAMQLAVAAAGFQRVALDLGGFRSGSLNLLAGVAGA